MTTLELIERGVGANCLSDAYDMGRADEQLQSIEDAKIQATEYLNALNKAKEEAYQQGRADQKKEDNEFFNFDGAWELEKQKIRKDAIDGINKIIQFIKDNSFNHKLEYDSFKAIGSSVMIELLEQLKEQKNE